MKAIRIHKENGVNVLIYEDMLKPVPKPGEVLVRVLAVGVTPSEFSWSTLWETSAGMKRNLPIPGHDMCGIVEALGPGVTGIEEGSAVYGLTDFTRDGADAEYTIALPGELAPKPHSLDCKLAAVVPLSGLTAWQALFEYAHLSEGQRILIHGAAGGVGTFAVQLAHWRGAHVIGTASAANLEFVKSLGADEVLDYRATQFERVVHEIDVVLDTVGGETVDRSWGLLKKGGILVSIISPPSQKQAETHQVQSTFFIVRPEPTQLDQIGRLIDEGKIHPVIDRVFPLAEAVQAFAASHTRGKTVLLL